jgi:hypothetical protein
MEITTDYSVNSKPLSSLAAKKSTQALRFGQSSTATSSLEARCHDIRLGIIEGRKNLHLHSSSILETVLTDHVHFVLQLSNRARRVYSSGEISKVQDIIQPVS